MQTDSSTIALLPFFSFFKEEWVMNECSQTNIWYDRRAQSWVRECTYMLWTRVMVSIFFFSQRLLKGVGHTVEAFAGKRRQCNVSYCSTMIECIRVRETWSGKSETERASDREDWRNERAWLLKRKTWDSPIEILWGERWKERVVIHKSEGGRQRERERMNTYTQIHQSGQAYTTSRNWCLTLAIDSPCATAM